MHIWKLQRAGVHPQGAGRSCKAAEAATTTFSRTRPDHAMHSEFIGLSL